IEESLRRSTILALVRSALRHQRVVRVHSLQFAKQRDSASARGTHFGFDQSVQFGLFGGREDGAAGARRAPAAHEFVEASLLLGSEEFVRTLVLHNNQGSGLFFG